MGHNQLKQGYSIMRHDYIAFLVMVAFLFSGFGTLVSCVTATDDKFKGISYNLTGILTPDNDLSLDEQPPGEIMDIPKPVQESIHLLARQALERWKRVLQKSGEAEDDFGLKLKDLYGKVFCIKVPEKRELFIFEENGLSGAVFYHFILFDPRTRNMTQNPPMIFGKWMQGGDSGGLLIKSIVSFDDIDQDGKAELVVQERVHNGTMYNAVVYHYFKIGDNLSLQRIFAFETRLVDLYTESLGGMIVRKFTTLSPFQLMLETFLEVRNQTAQKLGEAILIRHNEFSAFQVRSRQVLVSEYKDLLITGCEMDENDFLKTGCDFYY